MRNPTIVSGLAQPEGPAFSPDGTLVFVEMDESRQCLSTVTDGLRAMMVKPGGRPTGLAFDGDGCLWVAGGAANSLVRLAADGRELLRIEGDEEGPFLFPNDLAFGPDGMLYMTDSGMLPEEFITGLSIRPDFYSVHYAGAVFQINPAAGRVVRRIDANLRFANGIAFGPDGALYANETLSGWIYRYDLSGEAKREPYSQTLSSIQAERFNGPDGMAFDLEGNLYCALYGRGEVSVSDRSGQIVKRLATNGDRPTNVAFLPGETSIAVTEVQFGTVEKIDVAVAGAELHRPQIKVAAY